MLETTLVFGNRLEISESTLEKAANCDIRIKTSLGIGKSPLIQL